MSDLFVQSKYAQVERLELADADVRLFPSFLAAGEATRILSDLLDYTEWKQESVKVWGKWHPQPRLTAWHGDADAVYSYSGHRLVPRPWTPLLLDLKTRVEYTSGARFNSVLLNLYRNEADRMGWHRDYERELRPRPVIASLSLGQMRVFLMRHRTRKELGTSRIPLVHGSLLVMAGDTQEFWQHAIERESRPAGRRVNLTFRFVRNFACNMRHSANP